MNLQLVLCNFAIASCGVDLQRSCNWFNCIVVFRQVATDIGAARGAAPLLGVSQPFLAHVGRFWILRRSAARNFQGRKP